MDITDILAKAGGVQAIARELGVSEQDALRGAEALSPAILGGFKKQIKAQPSGIEGLGGMLTRLGGGGLLDEVLAPAPTNVSHGNEVLSQIFGSKDVSRTVAQNAAATSGLDSQLLKKMLPMLAMAVAGFMAKQSSGRGAAMPGTSSTGGGGGLGDVLGGMLGGQGRGGGGGLASLIDLDGDGNPLDDIMRMAGKAFK